MREVVLGVDPGLELGGVDVFHPAVWIADFGAEVVVGLVGFAGDGIGECGFGGCWSHLVRFPDFLLEDFAAALVARSFFRSAMKRFCCGAGRGRAARTFGGSLSKVRVWAARSSDSHWAGRRTSHRSTDTQNRRAT